MDARSRGHFARLRRTRPHLPRSSAHPAGPSVSRPGRPPGCGLHSDLGETTTMPTPRRPAPAKAKRPPLLDPRFAAGKAEALAVARPQQRDPERSGLARGPGATGSVRSPICCDAPLGGGRLLRVREQGREEKQHEGREGGEPLPPRGAGSPRAASPRPAQQEAATPAPPAGQQPAGGVTRPPGPQTAHDRRSFPLHAPRGALQRCVIRSSGAAADAP